MKKRLMLSGLLGLVLAVTPFFLLSFDVESNPGSSSVVQHRIYDNYEEIRESEYQDIDENEVNKQNTLDDDTSYYEEYYK